MHVLKPRTHIIPGPYVGTFPVFDCVAPIEKSKKMEITNYLENKLIRDR